MEILISLWSYDDRWMFQKHFSKSLWYIMSAITCLMALSSIFMWTSMQSIDALIGFRVLICTASSLTSLILGIHHDSPKHQRKQSYLVLILVFLGLINLSSMYSFQDLVEPDWKLTLLTKAQTILYYYPIIHILSIISCFFLIKLMVLFLAFANPNYLVKIRSKV